MSKSTRRSERLRSVPRKHMALSIAWLRLTEHLMKTPVSTSKHTLSRSHQSPNPPPKRRKKSAERERSWISKRRENLAASTCKSRTHPNKHDLTNSSRNSNNAKNQSSCLKKRSMMRTVTRISIWASSRRGSQRWMIVLAMRF